MKKTLLILLVLLGGLIGGLILSIVILDYSYQWFGVSFGSLILFLPVACAVIAFMMFRHKWKE
ncbi:hypothetical protein ETC05_14055 [Geobacillus sp. BMUD]|uniref:DUF5957 family protein n=1 Tax=Geobacillus sp. BMUD TaxID=2508876 RepID=UPI00149101A8|nr:DUF5957 family protein [Geobacillus sp. BMUD]NNU84898.1 hypothetical protein [Geobacillus sp. BMUD]